MQFGANKDWVFWFDETWVEKGDGIVGTKKKAKKKNKPKKEKGGAKK